MWTPATNRSRKPRFPYPIVRATLLALLSAGALWIAIDLTPPAPRSETAPPSAQRTPPVSRPAPRNEPPSPPSEQTAPAPTPEDDCPAGCDTSRPGCEIKGNISPRTGERIYHLPSQFYYGRTVISPEDGERWFCSEAEAVANGWRRAKV